MSWASWKTRPTGICLPGLPHSWARRWSQSSCCSCGRPPPGGCGAPTPPAAARSSPRARARGRLLCSRSSPVKDFTRTGSRRFREVRAFSIQRGVTFPRSFRNPLIAEPELDRNSRGSRAIGKPPTPLSLVVLGCGTVSGFQACAPDPPPEGRSVAKKAPALRCDIEWSPKEIQTVS